MIVMNKRTLFSTVALHSTPSGIKERIAGIEYPGSTFGIGQRDRAIDKRIESKSKPVLQCMLASGELQRRHTIMGIIMIEV